MFSEHRGLSFTAAASGRVWFAICNARTIRLRQASRWGWCRTRDAPCTVGVARTVWSGLIGILSPAGLSWKQQRVDRNGATCTLKLVNVVCFSSFHETKRLKESLGLAPLLPSAAYGKSRSKRKESKRKRKRRKERKKDRSGCLKCAGVVCPTGAQPRPPPSGLAARSFPCRPTVRP